MKRFVGFYHYGVLLTYMSVISAVIGIGLSAAGYPFFGGVICLWISGVCDAFDGVVARTRKNRTLEDKMFGAKIDSLSDVIAFGVAPVMIGYGMGMTEWYFQIPFVIYVMCAVCRLAYYDVEEDLRVQRGETGRRTHCEGLPVTNSAIGVPVFYLMAVMFRGYDGLIGVLVPKLIMCFCYLLVSFLMVFKFRMVKLGVKGVSVTIAVVVFICVGLILVNALVLDGSINHIFEKLY